MCSIEVRYCAAITSLPSLGINRSEDTCCGWVDQSPAKRCCNGSSRLIDSNPRRQRGRTAFVFSSLFVNRKFNFNKFQSIFNVKSFITAVCGMCIVSFVIKALSLIKSPGLLLQCRVSSRSVEEGELSLLKT